MSFFSRALNAYSEKFIRTGTIEPFIHVCSIIGTFAFIGECRHHHAMALAGEEFHKEKVEAAGHEVEKALEAFESHKALKKHLEETVAGAKFSIQESEKRISELEARTPVLEQAWKDAISAYDSLKSEKGEHGH